MAQALVGSRLHTRSKMPAVTTLRFLAVMIVANSKPSFPKTNGKNLQRAQETLEA
jgi:hypothetical protein